MISDKDIEFPVGEIKQRLIQCMLHRVSGQSQIRLKIHGTNQYLKQILAFESMCERVNIFFVFGLDDTVACEHARISEHGRVSEKPKMRLFSQANDQAVGRF